MRRVLAGNALYKATVDWMHYQEKLAPNLIAAVESPSPP